MPRTKRKRPKRGYHRPPRMRPMPPGIMPGPSTTSVKAQRARSLITSGATSGLPPSVLASLLNRIMGDDDSVRYSYSDSMEEYFEKGLKGITIEDLPYIELELPVEKYCIVEISKRFRIWGPRPPLWKKLFHKYTSWIMSGLFSIILRNYIR